MRARGRRGAGLVAGAVALVVIIAAVALALAAPSPVVLGGSHPESPAVSGGRVVWVDRTYGNADVFMHDAATGLTSRLTTDPADQVEPAVSGDIVVWSDHRSGRGVIRALDLASGTQRDLSPAFSDQVSPDISGNWVVWEDYRNTYNPGIYAFDLATGTERRIASGYGTDMRRPRVAGNLIVWEDYSRSAYGSDIKAYDLSTGATTLIAGTNASEVLPDTDGRYVVWAVAAPGGMNVMAFDTATGSTIRVVVGPGEQSFPRVSNGVVYWSDNVAGQRLHVDSFDLATRTGRVFNDYGVRDVVGFASRDGNAAWLARRGAGWQVDALIDGALAKRVTGLVTRILPKAATGVLDRLATKPYRPLSVTSMSVRSGQYVSGSRPSLRVWLSAAAAASSSNLAHIYLRDDRTGRRVRTLTTYLPTLHAVDLVPSTILGRGLYTIVVDDQLLDHKGSQIAAPAAVTFVLGGIQVQDTVPPSAPGNVVARVDTRSLVTLTWNPAVDNVAVTGYDVYRSVNPTQISNYSVDGSLVASVLVTGASVPVKSDEASKSYTYNYVVVSKDASGNKTASSNAVPDPHGQSSPLVSTCTGCHSVHGAAPGPALGAASATGCYGCHGGTAATAAYGYGSTFDTQARFQDDSVISTTGPMRVAGPLGSVHRNAVMDSTGHDCDSCHTPHRKPYDPTPSLSFHRLIRSQIATVVPTSTPSAAYRYNTDATPVASNVCLDCHGSAADNAQTLIGLVGGASAYTDANGDHRTNWTSTAHGNTSFVPTPAADLPTPAIQCLACHDEHGSKVPALLGTLDTTAGVSRMVYGSTPTTLTGDDKSVCYGCHTSASPSFPATSTGSRTASGFPSAGTWPGKATWDTTWSASTQTGSFHATSTVVWNGAGEAGGDCKNCHVIHGSNNQEALDILRRDAPGPATFGPATFGFCFKCHGAAGPSTVNIQRYYPTASGGTNAAARSGHRTLSAGNLPAGSALPCYDCHNPHGSATAFGLMIVTQSAGTTFTVGDQSSELTMTTSTRTPLDVRKFCLSCHTTADNASGWNGAAFAVVTAPANVEGIDRTTYNAAGAHLRLPAVSGHNSADTAMNCFTCHGQDYSGSASTNVHNPSGGISTGGTACYSCHGSYKDTMDMAGTSKMSVYHHVVGTSTVSYTGDIAPKAGSYPTQTANVYCVSCHVDHNYFNDGVVSFKGSNLRTNIDSATVAAGLATATTDFVAANNHGGICTSCHNVVEVKRTTSEKNDGVSVQTPRIDPATFTLSAHNYSVATSFGPSATDVFNPNCSKCHNDEQVKSYQTGAYRFGTHFSADRRLLSAFGATVVDPVRESNCFGCHSETSDVTSGTAKPLAGKDAYGALGGSMDTTSQKVFKVMHLNTASIHGTYPAKGSVTCVNCHNAHVSSATTKVVDPFNTYNTMSFNTTDTKVAFCLKCHTSGPYPVYTASAAVYVPSSTGLNGGWQVDMATNGARGHWSAYGSISSAERVPCTTCHDKHGSKAPDLLGVYNRVTGNNEISGTVITADDKSVCYACHTVASTGFSLYSRDASGYPQDGTWPGKATYDPSKHSGIPCTNMCHNVHGSYGLYDEMGNFSPTNFGACFLCHSSVFPAWHDIRAAYPVSAGGTSADSRSGHRTVTAGNLPAASALPCYDCHNPHGSAEATSMLMVETQSNGATLAIGDSAGEIDMTTPIGVRRFCFGCHTATDTGKGWSGSTTVTPVATDKVEGISRETTTGGQVLRLPDVNGHHEADAQSCYQCHGNDYSTSTSSNVHDPTGGVSAGGTSCYGCHAAYKDPMDAAGATRLNFFHHTLSSVTTAGDVAPNTGAYPTEQGNVYCVSCHTDHNYFNANPGANLRQGVGLAGSAATNTDFIAGGAPSYGVCLSCHTVSQTKDTANQKSNGSTKTATITGAPYDVSAHDYSAPATFGTSPFKANCSKCHDDEQVTSFQTGPYAFETHFSAEGRILAAFGFTAAQIAAANGQTEENACFKCHTGGVAGKDYYNVANMTVNARSIFAAITAAGSAHTVMKSSGVHRADESSANLGSAARHVECEDCHNPHAARAGVHASQTSTAGPVLYGAWGVQPSWPATNWIAPSSFTTVAMGGGATDYEAYVCFKCHSSYVTLPVSVTTTSGTYAPTNVALDFSPSNQSGHNVLGVATWPKASFLIGGTTYTWTVPTAAGMGLSGAWTLTSKMTCSDCHASNVSVARGPHGATTRYILKWGTAGTDWWSSTITGWANAQNFCNNCHTSNPTNTAHATGSHAGVACATCHIKIPHGWKRPRMIGYTTDSGLYTSTGLSGIQLTNYTATGPGASNCSNAGTCGFHGAVSPIWP